MAWPDVTAEAQELNVTVQVDRSRINSASLTYMNDFADNIEAYMNEFNWVEPNFGEDEKIDATIQITLLGVDDNFNFEASIVIRSERPIYNSLQQSPLFFYNDENWVFQYTPNRALVHDMLQFDPITTLLDYYAYIILGYDFDSFSEMGGTPYYSEAQNLVSLAQAISSTGWSRTSSVRRNRAQLVSDLLNPNYQVFREASYVYHRLGLDRFLDSPKEARQEVLRALEMIRDVTRNTTNNLLFNTFFNAKYREIVRIFEDAPTDVRLKAYNILSRIDQSHLSEYNKLQ
ncbi:DUF4835 family protein [Balneolaceae bacterium YR4-1]|uniref:DUF4835 family protein n=1 Tax=Halalkalibaculum roseum TaxID=2709311 RepID=A0A6M1SUU9_9BACT|nr:DUF4835 family protein [Halalkalibaculum roseum]NGP75908.1 DUF4835 family protein [Halalkalibaculum roseum]